MKLKKQTTLFSIYILLLSILAGCGQIQSPKMVNEMSFSLDGIKEVTISYDNEDITFFESKNDKLIVKEYMSKYKESYHAKVFEKNDQIQISEGGKPFLKGSFNRYIEVYLPVSYTQDLKVTTTNGDINIEDIALNLHSIRIDCTSGTVKIKEANASNISLSSTSGKFELESIAADKVRIDTTQGNVICNKVDGNVTYKSTSGNAEFKSAIGSGTFKANNSGKLKVNYIEVTGDISLYNKNDSIELSIPQTLDFYFEATTKNGSLSIDFKDDISINENTARGTVGENPDVSVKVESKNGDIKVNVMDSKI